MQQKSLCDNYRKIGNKKRKRAVRATFNSEFRTPHSAFLRCDNAEVKGDGSASCFARNRTVPFLVNLHSLHVIKVITHALFSFLLHTFFASQNLQLLFFFIVL